MAGRAVKMETWVGTDGQGLYRVELHYNRIDRRRRHTLSHNLGLQSRLKCISHSWILTALCTDDVRQFNRNTHVKLPGTQNIAYARHWHLLMSVVLNVSSSTTRTPCAMLHDKCTICIWSRFLSFIYIVHFMCWTPEFLNGLRTKLHMGCRQNISRHNYFYSSVEMNTIW